MSNKFHCAECDQELESPLTRHTFEDCLAYKLTLAARKRDQAQAELERILKGDKINESNLRNQRPRP